MAGHSITFWDSLGISSGVSAFQYNIHIPFKHDTGLERMFIYR
jgi:hypothetical protein